MNGFSLIELMVAIGILVLVNSIILSNYPEFNRRMALKKTSEEVALIARRAQAYSLGVKRSASGSDNFFGFGVHFDKNNPKSLILFTDSDSDKTYDNGELFQEFKIDTGDYVSELQTYDLSKGYSSVNTLDVVYPRASSIAKINNGDASYALVTITSPRGEKKIITIITIWINGTITVN